MGKIVTKTFTTGDFLTMDSYIDEVNPTYNYGLETRLKCEYTFGNRDNIVFNINIPSTITTTTGNIENPILKNLKLYLYHDGGSGATPRIFHFINMTNNFLEGTGTGSATGDGVTWNTRDGVLNWNDAGGDIGNNICSLTLNPTDTGWNIWDFTPSITYNNYKLGDNILCQIYAEIIGDTYWLYYGSKETTNTGQMPYIEITYEDPSPTKIIDLTIQPHDNYIVPSGFWSGYITPEEKYYHIQPKLTWSKNEDEDFVQYRIYRTTSTGTIPMISTNQIGNPITNQAENYYIDTTAVGTCLGLEPNVRYYYGVSVEDNNNKYISDVDTTGTLSNIVSFIRPDLTINVPGTQTINVWEAANIDYGTTSSGDAHYYRYETTLGSSSIGNVYFEWGDGGSANSLNQSRDHIYTKTGIFAARITIENSEGFKSDLSGPDITVEGIVPIGVIKVSPIFAEPCQSVYANASESYARASNLSLTGYSFTVGGITTNTGTVPIKEYKFTETVGTTKVIYLEVSDSAGSFSDLVSYTITVSPANIYCLNLENPVETVGREKKRNYSIVNKLGAEGQDIAGTGSSNEILKLKGIIHANKNEDEWDILWELSRGNYLVDYRQPSYSDYNEILRGYLTNFSDERVGGETGIKAYWNSDFIVKKRMVEKTLSSCVFTANAGGSYYDIPSTEYPVGDANSDGVVNASYCNGEYDVIVGTTQNIGAIEVDANYEYRRIKLTVTTGTTENITYFYESV